MFARPSPPGLAHEHSPLPFRPRAGLTRLQRAVAASALVLVAASRSLPPADAACQLRPFGSYHHRHHHGQPRLAPSSLAFLHRSAPFPSSLSSSSSFHAGRVLPLAAAPRKRLPDRTVEVRCSGCRALLYKYAKANGKGSNLVKCYHERILEDHTQPPGSLFCPQCEAEFARPAMVHGRPANKIIGGKVYMK